MAMSSKAMQVSLSMSLLVFCVEQSYIMYDICNVLKFRASKFTSCMTHVMSLSTTMRAIP